MFIIVENTKYVSIINLANVFVNLWILTTTTVDLNDFFLNFGILYNIFAESINLIWVQNFKLTIEKE